MAEPLQLVSNTTIIGGPAVKFVSTINPMQPKPGGNLNSLFYNAAQFGATGTLSAGVTPGATSFSCSFNPGGPGTIVSIATTAAIPRVQAYVVQSVSGGGPYTVNVDRPILRTYQIGGAVTVLTSRPTNIQVIGNGMQLTGTGYRFWSIVYAFRCLLQNVDANSTALTAEYAASFDSGGLENTYRGVKVNAESVSATGITFESNEAGRAYECETFNATAGYGGLAVDCDDVIFYDHTAYGNGNGVGFVSLIGTGPGCQACGTIGGNFNGNTNAGAIFTQGATDCFAVGTCAGAGNTAVACNGSTSARVSNGCDFSGVATAYATAGSGAISRGTVAANGSTPVATAFPDFLATDKVTITPTASVGLAFVSSKTAGTGFSITSTAGDTQTYDYVIE